MCGSAGTFSPRPKSISRASICCMTSIWRSTTRPAMRRNMCRVLLCSASGRTFRMRANRIMVGLALTLAALALGRQPAQGQASLEYAVKAAYLTKFAPFIEWPDGVFANPGAPVNICVLGNDPFGAVLDKAAAAGGGGRPIAIHRLASNDPADGCQIGF